MSDTINALLFYALLFAGFALVPLGYYLIGFLAWWKRGRSSLAFRAWAISFIGVAVYALFDGVIKQIPFEIRAREFATLRLFDPPPSDVRVISLPPHPDGYGCGNICVALLWSGRFDRVIKHDWQSGVRPLQAFEMVARPGCRSVTAVDQRDLAAALKVWEVVGRCLVESDNVDRVAPRFAVSVNEEAPDNPSWASRVIDVALVGRGAGQGIARMEHGLAHFAVPLPIVGLYLSSRLGGGVDLTFGLWSYARRYGQEPDLGRVIAAAFGIDVAQFPGTPDIQAIEEPARKLAVARQIVAGAPRRDRYRLIDALDAMRPLDPDYTAVLIDLARTADWDLMPSIAWLGASDDALGPLLAAFFVDQIAGGATPRPYAAALNYFSAVQLAPHADRLLAAYDRRFPNERDHAQFISDLDAAIGLVGPAGVARLADELPKVANNPDRSAAIALGLCRSGAPAAIEPLERHVKWIEAGGRFESPMAYAYAFARLGHGDRAKAFVAHARTRRTNFSAITDSELACLDEIVTRFPLGGAPASICQRNGPRPEFKASAVDAARGTCLAPRTPPRQ
jgi:hypothetical protein